ncbi:hypothetical protein JW707_02945, partial [Candidatus Woesearchaeota archaeon]|nr:hypothetical protein [Candidatus Woesearchaeota archaeon]
MKKVFLLFALLMVFPVLANAEILNYETGIYEEYDMDEWTLLYIQNGDLWEADGELNEPVTIQKFDIPSDKAIKSIEITEKRSPKEFKLNLPQVEYSGDYYSYVPRDCYYDQREAYMVVSSYDYADTASVSLEVHPMEITDCEKGVFTLYREMDFEIEYYEENKIKSVDYDSLTPGEETTLNFELENRNPESEIIVYDDWGNELASKEVYSDTEKVAVAVPGDTPNLYLNVEYYEEGNVVDRAVITQNLDWGDMDFRVLVSESVLEFPLALQIDNEKGEEISVKLKIASINSES